MRARRGSRTTFRTLVAFLGLEETGKVAQGQVERELRRCQQELKQDVEPAQACHEAHGARGSEQMTARDQGSLGKVEVCGTEQHKGNGNEEEDPDEDKVGAERRHRQHRDVDGPGEQVESKRRVKVRGVRRKRRCDAVLWVEENCQAEPEEAEGDELPKRKKGFVN